MALKLVMRFGHSFKFYSHFAGLKMHILGFHFRGKGIKVKAIPLLSPFKLR